MATCFACGASLDTVGRVYRNTLCPSCGKDARVCRNCRFYEPGAHWDCRETISEPVRDKDRANFCDFFMLSQTSAPPGKKTQENDKSTEARSKFDNLFGNE
ncbi:MAG TPA: hypothetical protein VMW87_02330 [Spirochaetia bacterium]|nr:hypothetical protein [Spirochaetia bacterium]